LRWYIIHDRYDYPDGVARTLEVCWVRGMDEYMTFINCDIQDLKDRYYSVCRKLVRNRPWAGDDASKNSLLTSFQFDKGKVTLFSHFAQMPDQTMLFRTEREMTRKKYVASLESRTPEQISEEEALYVEIKRLEQNERRFKRERDELLKTLVGIESGLPEIVGMVDDDGPMGGSVEIGGKRRRRGTLDTPMTPSNVISLGPPAPRRAQSARSAAFGKSPSIKLLPILLFS
jgi:DNA methyltransferase 1-associated protein 1